MASTPQQDASVDSVINQLTRDIRGTGSSYGLPSWSWQQAGENIAKGVTDITTSWNGYGVNHQHADITYAFPDWPYDRTAISGLDSKVSGLSQFTELQQQQAREVLGAWADIADITLTEVAPDDIDAQITYGNYEASSGQAFTGYPPEGLPESDGRRTAGASWYNIDYESYPPVHDNLYPEIGNYGRHNLVHETGHALGLSHAGNYDGTLADGWRAEYAQDTRQFTVMSYYDEQYSGADFKGHYAAGPLLDDIAAIQYLYGANMDTRSGDTTYGFNSNADRDYFRATSSDDVLIFSVWDTGGTNTFDFSGYSDDQNINLNELSFSDIGGASKNVSIAKGVNIHNAVGGSGDDVITGNGLANQLAGGAGDDILYGAGGGDQLTGGAGKDTFVFMDITDSPTDQPTTITDFTSGEDSLDLTGLTDLYDMNGLQSVEAFSGTAGDVVVKPLSDAHSQQLQIDVSGNNKAEMIITVVGSFDITQDLVA